MAFGLGLESFTRTRAQPWMRHLKNSHELLITVQFVQVRVLVLEFESESDDKNFSRVQVRVLVFEFESESDNKNFFESESSCLNSSPSPTIQFFFESESKSESSCLNSSPSATMKFFSSPSPYSLIRVRVRQ